MDISKQVTNNSLGPFLTGAICSNLAWLCIWPLDVVKTQLQSGNFEGKSFSFLVRDIITTGKLFRGVIPGKSKSKRKEKIVLA